MKRIVASIGAAAIGSTAIQQAQAVSLTPQESTKPWSVGVALRGFYDDNYLLAPRSNPNVPESFGFEVRPTVGLNIPLEQTYFGLDLTYSGQWYEDDSHWDHAFLANAMFNHAFTERVTLDVQDRFVWSDRPELTDPTLSTTIRTDQQNINNRGNVQLAVGMSPRLGLVLAYQNLFWDYKNQNAAAETSPIPPALGGASLSATLDRIEQTIPINLRHQTGPATSTMIGYSYGMVDYTSNEYLGVNATAKSDSRNNRSHYAYIGVEHNFSPLLSLGVKGGGQYTDYYNDDMSNARWTPYGDISLLYFYTKGSSVEAGYNLSQQATDILAYTGSVGVPGQVTQNRLTSSLFARVDHQFLPNFHGNLYGQWMLSSYNGGSVDGDNENLYLVGVSLSYDINRFLAVDVGYKFDYLDNGLSTSGRGYTRNRVHIGLTASY